MRGHTEPAGAARAAGHDRAAAPEDIPPRRGVDVGSPAVASGALVGRRSCRRRGSIGGRVVRAEGVRAAIPEIVVPRKVRARTSFATVFHGDPASLMVRTVRGLRITGVEATLLRLAHELDDEAFEIACEDARRRRLTSVPAMRAYLDRFAQRGRPGVASMRRLLDQLDPRHPSRSTLEVKTRRLLVAHGITNFVREFPLDWNGRTHRFDFAFLDATTVLETNGRRWHDDPSDYEDDNEKWSVPGRHGYRLVLATWEKVTRKPG